MAADMPTMRTLGVSSARSAMLAFIVAAALCAAFSGCASKSVEAAGFPIEGIWKSSGGTTISFQSGRVSASLFGFKGGPDGTYQMSSRKADGAYELYASHITGGEVEYRLTVRDDDHITLDLTTKSTFASKHLSLVRK